MLLRQNRRFTTIILIFVLITMIAGCTPKEERMRADLLAALDQYEQFEHFRFKGSATMRFSPLPASSVLDEPTGALLQSIMQSDLQWEGTMDKTANRWEMILNVEPADYGLSLQIPIILDNSTVYFHLPLMNKPEEYWRIEMKDSPALDLHDTSLAFQRMLRHLAEAMDARVYSTQRKADSSHNKIRMELNQKNLETWMISIGKVMPDILNELMQAKLVHPSVIEQWKNKMNTIDWKAVADDITVTEPSGITVTINEDGEAVGFHYSFHFKLADQAETFKIQYDVQLENINEQPPFKLEIPEATRSIDDILKLIAPLPN